MQRNGINLQSLTTWLAVIGFAATGMLPMRALVVCRSTDGQSQLELSHVESHDHLHHDSSVSSCSHHTLGKQVGHANNTDSSSKPPSQQTPEHCEDDSLASDQTCPTETDDVAINLPPAGALFELFQACSSVSMLRAQATDPPLSLSLLFSRSIILQV